MKKTSAGKVVIVETRGGYRKGSGRKAVADKKEPIFIYPKSSEINILGGADAVKALCTGLISKMAAKKK